MFLGKEKSFTDKNLRATYLDWIEDVKLHVPKEQLLEFNVKQGWEPLCEFLGLPGTNILSIFILLIFL